MCFALAGIQHTDAFIPKLSDVFYILIVYNVIQL